MYPPERLGVRTNVFPWLSTPKVWDFGFEVSRRLVNPPELLGVNGIESLAEEIPAVKDNNNNNIIKRTVLFIVFSL
jgi:hypothetical protein